MIRRLRRRLSQREALMRANLIATGYEPARVDRIVSMARAMLDAHLRDRLRPAGKSTVITVTIIDEN